MKVSTIITCLLVGAVIGTLSDSEELSSDLLDCLEESHPWYRQSVKHREKCKEEFPSPPKDLNEDGIDMALDPHQYERWQCYEKVHTPEFRAKLKDWGERCFVIVSKTPDSQREKVESLMEQEEWSRG